MSEEMIVLLDEAGQEIGAAPKLDTHNQDTPLHLAFTAYAFTLDGELLLTRRSETKKTWPGTWTNTCCGHPAPGERLEAAVARRVTSELGVAVLRAEVVLARVQYRAVMPNGIIENEMGPVLRVLLGGQPRPDPAETDQIRWVPWQHAVDMAETGGLSPWSEITIRALVRLGTDPWRWPVVDPSSAIPALVRPSARHPVKS